MEGIHPKSNHPDDTLVISALEFKKPLLPLPVKKVKPKTEPTPVPSNENESTPQSLTLNETIIEEENVGKVVKEPPKQEEINLGKLYSEPPWSGLCTGPFSLEVLKSGIIIETLSLNLKPYIVFGRHVSCDKHLEHPSVSRFHAILQYRPEKANDIEAGFYIYDLGSVHGTFLNKKKIEPRIYYRFHIGHMVKFGGSSRMFILQGPDDVIDNEEDNAGEETVDSNEQEIEEGIDWGMSDDAVEDNVRENLFTLDGPSGNEELYLDDPKKTLRGWFEREGYELEYKCHEEGYSKFLCCVELPVDGPNGEQLMAQASVKGRKKEAVFQCALEACRLLDKYGLLRQSQRDSHSKKAKNWEDNDFYDSDEDEFLDRTGEIEEKRKRRMKAAGRMDDNPDTYETLESKHSDVTQKIDKIEKSLEEIRLLEESQAGDGDDIDSLDAFMSSLKKAPNDSKEKKKMLKMSLVKLKLEEKRLASLMKVAKPASLPPLKPPPIQDVNVVSSEGCSPFVSLETKDDQGPEVGLKRRAEKRKAPSPVADTGADNQKSDTGLDNEQENKSVKLANLAVNNRKSLGPFLPSNFSQKRKSTNNIEDGKVKKIDHQCDFEDEEKYAGWMPPEDQSGDGRTKLNERFGY